MKIDVFNVESDKFREGGISAAIYEQIKDLKEKEGKVLPSFFDSFKNKQYSEEDIRAAIAYIAKKIKFSYVTHSNESGIYIKIRRYK